ncbi:haloacid dehalogenase type II [Scleromatobacter humisilvae]|uniref:(S)-2-haloacid dehalogenase n=1 Tax=Scleromatobacter humisilvae TaxID=2897159 RepID=A0A9X2BYR5_9BURK|nr:haloacid dehalogenase type II [Scleromatobacter humisilvae]MCK9685893.1 haloacid dehalogenase type II [Scleromatobacter humisilvae]
MDARTPSADRFAPPKAVLFDVYGTLLDVYSVGLRAEQMFPGAGERLARAWRDKQIEYSRLVSMSGQYRPFWQLTRDALQVTAQALRLPLDAAGEDSLMNEYRHLSAFPENRAVLLALADRGIRTGVLSNGDPEMLEVTLRSAGMVELIDPILSVHATRRYKTDPAAYALGPDALGLPASDILFVSSNCWDAIGATWYGYTTLWINRADAPMERLGIQPTRVGHSLRDVLEFF